MTRGLGQLQRSILLALEDAGTASGEGLCPFELRRELRTSERSNTRRALRSLISRGLVEEDGGRLKLTFSGGLVVHFRLRQPYDDDDVVDPLREEREWRHKVDERMAAIQAAHEDRLRLYRERESQWDKSGRSSRRRSAPGPNQLRVLATLIRYAANPQLGLPKGAVRRIAGGDQANVNRAISALLRHGTIQRTKDGQRLRLANWRTEAWWPWGPALTTSGVELDDRHAREVLEGFKEPMRGVA